MNITLTHHNMLDDESIARLNQEVRDLIGSMNARDAIQSVLARHRFNLIYTSNPEDTSGGYVELWQDPDGLYATVWLVSSFAHAVDVTTPAAWDGAYLGFDNQVDWG